MRSFLYVMLCVFAIVALTGCCERISRPYVMETDRADQKMDVGNRGYLKGTPPPAPDRSGLKRPFIAVDIDLPETPVNEAPAVQEPAPVKEENIK